MRCSECDVNNDDLRRCTGCNLVQYCSRKCQRKHWTVHKAECEALRYKLTACGQDCEAQEGDKHAVGLDTVSPFVIDPDQMEASNVKHCAVADSSTASDTNAVKPGANKPIDEDGGACGRRGDLGICCYCENTGLMRTCSRCKMAKYCDKTCQERHWPKHSSACFKQRRSLKGRKTKKCEQKQTGKMHKKSFTDSVTAIKDELLSESLDIEIDNKHDAELPVKNIVDEQTPDSVTMQPAIIVSSIDHQPDDTISMSKLDDISRTATMADTCLNQNTSVVSEILTDQSTESAVSVEKFAISGSDKHEVSEDKKTDVMVVDNDQNVASELKNDVEIDTKDKKTGIGTEPVKKEAGFPASDIITEVTRYAGENVCVDDETEFALTGATCDVTPVKYMIPNESDIAAKIQKLYAGKDDRTETTFIGGRGTSDGSKVDMIGEENLRCSECAAKKDDLRRCTGCRLVQYCSRKCQRKHWTVHKAECEARWSKLTSCGQDCEAQEGDTHTLGLDTVSPFVIDPDQIDASNVKHCAAADSATASATASDKIAVKPGANKPIDENGGACGRRGDVGICCYFENTGLMKTCSRCKMAKYCDKTFQKWHWQKHGSACFKQTTSMEDEQARHSRYLSEILDSHGYSEDIRKIAIKVSTTSAIVNTVTDQLLSENKHVATYMFGSWSEGTTCGIKSDIDTLFCDDSIPIVDRPEDRPVSGPCLLTVSNTNIRTGYTKLQLLGNINPLKFEWYDSKLFTVDGRGRVMRNHLPIFQGLLENSYVRNGPAARIPFAGYDCDLVYAFRYRKWPAIAMEWNTRVRCYNWPSTEVIKKLCSLGCFLVAKGHSQSSDVDLEWRFSFSLQERELMRSLNAVQFKCYVLLKYIKTEKLTSDLGESITSYHCKTCLFYAIESTAADFWTPDNLIECLLMCLRKLCEWLKDGFCPNYFIPEDNMFERKLHGELLGKTTSILENVLLMEHKYQFIFDLKIGNRRSAMRSAVEDNMIPANQNFDMVLVYARSVVILTLGRIAHLLSSTVVNNELVPCIEAHLKLIEYLTNTKTVAGHTEEQTTEAIDLILPSLYTSLASHEAAQLIQLTTEGPETERIKLSMYKHIERGFQSCLISCQLKVAAIHYMLGEYEASEKILSAVPLMLHKEMRKNVCCCSVRIRLPRNDVCVDNQMLSGFKSGTVPWSELLKYSPCVSFLPTEKAITPSAMLYENPVVPEDGVGNNWAVVDFIAFEYYMQYLVYDKLGKTDKKQLAVQNLKQHIREDDSVYHEELAFKLLDWILEQEKSY